MLGGVKPPRPSEPFPDPPGADAIARWLAGLPGRLGMQRHWRWWLIGSMLLVVALAVLRAPLGAWLWPQTRAQALHAEAEHALARGLLSAQDGRGARELFEAAIAMDPDRGEARQGLARVALAALAQARTALAEDRFEDTHRLLALARELSVPRADADALARTLREREAGHAGIDGIFARAGQAHAEGRLQAGADAALPLYARVLALAPTHPGALRGREDALGELLAQAREALRAGDIEQAVVLVATAQRYDPAHIDLTDTVARLMEESGLDGEGVARLLAGDPVATGSPGGGRGHGERMDVAAMEPEERARRVAALLTDADAARAAGNVFAPAGESAVDKLAEARALDAGDDGVQAAVARLLPAARECHTLALRGNRLRSAAACLDARAALGDDAASLAAARRQLAERWLAVGDERLGAGEIGNARSALAAARMADPGLPGLADFELRVRAAAAALR